MVTLSETNLLVNNTILLRMTSLLMTTKKGGVFPKDASHNSHSPIKRSIWDITLAD